MGEGWIRWLGRTENAHWDEELMFKVNIEKRQALIDLLSLPDAPDLRRGHHRTVEGRSDRYRMLPHLAASFVQWHMMEMEERRAETSPEVIGH